MSTKAKDLSGLKFGHLLVIKRSKRNDHNLIYWDCICDCGKITTRLGSNLKSKIKLHSCHNCPLTHHFQTGQPLRNRYKEMLYRCYKPTVKPYKNYGGRGITVCDEWRNNYFSFKSWSENNGYLPTLSLDRIDNDGNYSPENCRWVNRKIQSNNKRSNRVIEYNGHSKTMSQWSDSLNIPYTLLRDRLNKLKWSFEKSIVKPKRKRSKNR